MCARAVHGKAGWDGGQIVADVLDAWFDPSHEAIAAFCAGPTLIRRSADLESTDLLQALSDVRGLAKDCITLGAGSSELIHRVLPQVVGRGPVVLLDPTYSEYAFVLGRLGVAIRRLALDPANGFRVDADQLAHACQGASLVVLVNPNNPTGVALTYDQVRHIRSAISPEAVLWVDEAYVDYAPPGTSVETWAFGQPNMLVLKSMSKAYALSGARAAYLAGERVITARFQQSTPPWIIGCAAQAAATAALRSETYYRVRWAETAALTKGLANELVAMGLEVFFGCIPAVLVRVPAGMTATAWRDSLARLGVAIRSPEGMGEVLGERFIRISVVPSAQMSKLLSAVKMSMG